MRTILGISAFFHDSAAALVVNGEIIAAAQEERFSRRKNDERFPSLAVAACLKHAGLSEADIEAVVFYDKPITKFVRSVETWMAVAPQGTRSFVDVLPQWIEGRLNVEGTIRDELPGLRRACPILYSTHHQAHAASAFYPSPFSEAAILTVDGVGEYATTTVSQGRGTEITLLQELRFPHSLGLLYSAFTAYCGFHVNSGEYKLMGLAPYGEPTFLNAIRDHLVDLRPDGSFRLNLEYFGFMGGKSMTNDRFHRLLGGPPRLPNEPLEPRHLNVARSIQVVTEQAMLALARYAKERTGMRHLCLAGGVALNCVANGRLLREALFDDLWIQPAAGDAGAALGAALLAWYDRGGTSPPSRIPQERDSMQGSRLGPAYSNDEIERFLREEGAIFQKIEPDQVIPITARLLAEQRVIGWFQGRMEFGPRALGSRSILGDARSPSMQSVMNLKIKFRESFRPFAPMVPLERVSEYFDLDRRSPYMLLVAEVRDALRNPRPGGIEGLGALRHPHSSIPAVTHVDYSARIQTVDPREQPQLHALLTQFAEITGSAVLVNTSFNIRDEPIVESPRDAYRCFLKTAMDAMIIGDFLILRSRQPVPIPESLSLPPSRKRRWPEPPRLKDRPSEWRKFAGVWSVAIMALVFLATKKSWISPDLAWALFGAVGIAWCAGLCRPIWVRPLYRGVMTGVFYVGLPARFVLLHLFYWGVMTGFALVIRRFRSAPFELARDPKKKTYWETSPPLRGLGRPS